MKLTIAGSICRLYGQLYYLYTLLYCFQGVSSATPTFVRTLYIILLFRFLPLIFGAFRRTRPHRSVDSQRFTARLWFHTVFSPVGPPEVRERIAARTLVNCVRRKRETFRETTSTTGRFSAKGRKKKKKKKKRKVLGFNAAAAAAAPAVSRVPRGGVSSCVTRRRRPGSSSGRGNRKRRKHSVETVQVKIKVDRR